MAAPNPRDRASKEPAAAALTPDADPVLRDPGTIDDLDAAIGRLIRGLHAETYRLLMLVRDFDDRFGFAKWGYRTCAEWLAWRHQISLSAAREKVRAAQALRYLPEISDAFEAGRISYSKVRALTRVAEPHNEDLLLAYALEATAPQVEDRCRQMRNGSPAAGEAAKRAWERRSLTVMRNPGQGTVLITVELPVDDGEVVVRALESAVAGGDVAVGSDYTGAHGFDERGDAVNGWRAQQADALVVLAKAYLARSATDGPAGEGPPASTRATGTSVADHYQVVVHVDEEALRGGVGRSDLPLETMLRITCDGSLVALVEDGDGEPLALGRKQRVVSTALRRAVWSRDGGCTFPGCHRRHYVDHHHIRHWADGGRTDLDNLTLLCSFHHRLLHEGSFRVRRGRDGLLEFLRADGCVIPRSGYRASDWTDDDGDASEPFARDHDGAGSAVETSRAHRFGDPSTEGLRTFSVPTPAAEGTRAPYDLEPSTEGRHAFRVPGSSTEVRESCARYFVPARTHLHRQRAGPV